MSKRLKKQLKLFDVYSISTGAMFSSGFFLLPGLAYASAGPAVIVAYLFAGFLIIPAMLSQAELATAMPRAGGSYYFLDRALGPMVGTVGGLGTWLALVLKTAFALVGVGAYLVLLVDVPLYVIAISLTFVFMIFNIVGAKESSSLQRILVTALVGILAIFIVAGLYQMIFGDVATKAEERLTPFFTTGTEGVLATMGMVFVSYAGLTKVASVAEEVQDPDRDIPLGMWLSLITATGIYVIGVLIMVVVIDPSVLRGDITPVATAADELFSWLPGEHVALIAIVIAAFAAFASTGNAGIMSSSRYLLAMGRDQLVSEKFAHLGRFQTPTLAVIVTSAAVGVCILTLDVSSLAKLASAFQLLIFSLINLAVIVMRESRIAAYDPGYRSPLYPWIQIVGFIGPLVLISELGHMPMAFTLGIVALCLVWYFWYARGRVTRTGAVMFWFARMGRRQFPGLETELREILKERGLRDGDPFASIVSRAPVIDLEHAEHFDEVAERAAEVLAQGTAIEADTLASEFCRGNRIGATPAARGAALPHARVDGVSSPALAIVRVRSGLTIELGEGAERRSEIAYALFFLVSPTDDPTRHLRMLAHLAQRADDNRFLPAWRDAEADSDLKPLLLMSADSPDSTPSDDALVTQSA